MFGYGVVDLYVSIYRTENRSLVEVSNLWKNGFDREAFLVQRDVCDAICSTARGAQKLFVDVPDAVGRSPSLTVEYARLLELAKP